MVENTRLRTVVCGSRFGQFYLEAVKALPEQFELAGLVAKGSERSRKCAERYGIPLYTEVDQLPANIDFACVVLRSGVMGGNGSELSLKLLARNIHVIQEQPIHHKDLAACLKMARQHGVHFRTGDLYVHLPAVRRFIACTRAMLEQQPALYIDAACATQVSYPLMHLLQEALPTIRPWKISHVIKGEGPFQVLAGLLGKIPITLRAHNEVDPQDPDNHLHLLHRVTIGVAGGSLSLVDTHGPVVWQPRLHVPDCHNIHGALSTAPPVHLLENSTQILGTAAPTSYKEILLKQWPHAIGRDLSAMREIIMENAANSAMDTRAQQELLCSRQWQDWTQALGYPVLQSNCSHQPLSVDILKDAALKIVEDSKEHSGPMPHPKAESDVFTCTAYAEDEVLGVDARQVKECVARLDEAALSSMLFALQSQGTLITAEYEYSEADIFSAVKVAPCHQHVLLRWLQILKERGYLVQRGENYQCVHRMTPERVYERWNAVKGVWNGKLGSSVVIDYLMTNAEQLPQLMSGNQQAVMLLFPEGRMNVANALYCDTRIARYLNKSVAEAVIRIAAGKQASCNPLSNAASQDSLRILEVGAGTGATTDVVVQRLRASVFGGVKPDYLFTDISNFFLAAARERFKDCPWMRFKIVDIDKNLFEQGLKPGSVHIVIAAGMLNNARDTDKVIQGLMQILVPEGWMLITEPTREFPEMLISQAFMMTHPEDDRRNTQTTFMYTKQWLDVFYRAGAQEVMALPDEDHPLAPLGQKLFVVKKGTT
ncbi:bifunctional Gfo/Idh/MocA family oxidoreductase/class I SAM-dependent methyltransferase [Aneurinibacillus aneurinilyticus]|uniref:Thiazolinyl imide reductase n=1 Tax=Aneurinibacillus aneurinilyticus ATCC 12856 TaxID=649747 RepID=U1YG37_ANEAE|nr:bifunctional Gfo/Idh/MocA family oxidoreductase/class I SAM-dependent methyltransferase [Aneurinibacillus aneurinilyticus]ERI11047.1 thiazolinyl imide reductase [Aneurinibacillus aneurinilyticus ATCC 12856]MED0708775.1 bifunctional Gfo/Idh/MocA family oxidoreductase/class I SAM-dependent methyltransferase [Aneurinibacillus aneurinilyticus]MED0722758.1 bifunctional Gfo/Idh/MocA family oxidoreductase/class I SAM-dependent methyltransferase [Aneurinibacillus aneurinilyticus]MED0733590.1 bifunct